MSFRVLPFTAYADRWDEIAAVFSPAAIMQGAFDRYAESTTGKRGTAEVDDVFLAEIESWRSILARNLALRNHGLTQRELNVAVQSTIDRIIFLRICEDRGIETYGRLLGQTNGAGVYSRLTQLFREADARYNSGLFHFEEERGRPEAPDGLTLALSVDDKPLRDIVRGLYYPDSPYEFSVVSAAILGQVYEQFLGQVIRLTPGHRAVVEVKPEVKKAGGVKYTPTYISEQLVNKTLGRLLEGKSPREAAGMEPPGAAGSPPTDPVRVLDLSCGSGSILLVAYQYLLDWHLDWYNEHLVPLLREGKAPTSSQTQAVLPGAPRPKTRRGRSKADPLPIYQDAGGEWRLTTAERKRILLTHIYGVDIDAQAVEVTKLSLLLKVLEDENERTLGTQLQLFQERALPDLGQNIKCGNSLIGPEFYDGRQLGLLDDADRYRINAFDWRTEFPQVFARADGGFDVVIGNPPYIRIQTMKEWAPLEVEYYKTAYRAASSGNYDIYAVFVERGLDLLSGRGLLGFILPHKFFNAKYGTPLRGLLASGRHLAEVVHFGDQQVFRGVTTYTCLMFLDKCGAERCRVSKVTDLDAWRATGAANEGTVPAETVTDSEWQFNVGRAATLLERLAQQPVTLANVAHLFVGLQTNADDVFILERLREDCGSIVCRSRATGRDHLFESEHLKPFLKGSLNIRRYALADVTKMLIFPYETRAGKSVLIPSEMYRRRFPLAWAYLSENRTRLSARNKGRMGNEWYGYVYKKNHTRFTDPKLLVPSIARGSAFAADLDGKYYFVGSGGGGGGGYGIGVHKDCRLSRLYVLGLLNSRLLETYLRAVSTPYSGGYFALNRQYIERLPIRVIDFANATDEARHDRMVHLVTGMLDLHRRSADANIPQEKAVIERQIVTTDRQIDRLVYELYEVTDEEIMVVEEVTT